MTTQPNNLESAVSRLQDAYARLLGAVAHAETRLKKAEQQEREQTRSRSSGAAALASRAQMRTAESARKALGVAAAAITNPTETNCCVAEYVSPGDLVLNSLGDTPAPTIPCLVPLLGHGNILIQSESSETVASVLRRLTLEAVTKTRADTLAISVCDTSLHNTLAPFSALNSRRSNIYTSASTDTDFRTILGDAREQMTHAASCAAAFPSYLDYLLNQTEDDTSIALRLLVLDNYPVGVTKESHQQLIPILKAGPAAGVSTLITLADRKEWPEWFSLDDLKDKTTTLSINGDTIRANIPVACDANLVPTGSDDVARVLATYLEEAQTRLEFDFADAVSTSTWNETSTEGVTLAFAGASHEPHTVVLGDNLVHGLITGATGEGKSNLIKVLIYSIASRYSPTEVEFVLLDFKEGVTLAPFAPSSNSPAYLPHARILGLDADQDFGLAVLNELERIYKERMARMKPLDNIRAFRKAHPDEQIPRIVVIIDEFQGLLAENEERTGNKAAKMLLDLVRKVRAAGIHILLASQEIGSISTLLGQRDGLLSQIKLRVGLKNTPREAEQTFQSGNDAAAALERKGEVIINESFGELDANVRAQVPYAEPEILDSLLKTWHQAAADSTPPQVFDGTALATWPLVGANATAHDAVPTCFLGHRIAPDLAPVSFSFERSPGRNLAIIGSATDPDALAIGDTSVAQPFAALRAASISTVNAAANLQGEIIVVDLLSSADRLLLELPQWIESMAHKVDKTTTVSRDKALETLVGLYETLENRTSDSPPVFVFILGMDRIGSLDAQYNGTFTRMNQIIQQLWENGPTVGIHTLATYQNTETFGQHTANQPRKYFEGLLLYAGTESLAKRIDNPLSAWNGDDRRALFKDFASARPAEKIVPFALSVMDERKG